MAKPNADYSGMTDFESAKFSDKEASIKQGIYPVGKGQIQGDDNLGAFECCETNADVHYSASQLFDEDFGPRVPLDEDIIPGLPGGKKISPHYSGDGTGHISTNPPGFDDF